MLPAARRPLRALKKAMFTRYKKGDMGWDLQALV